jgi:hypothetical protein
MFPNHLNFYFNYKISGDTSGRLVFLAIDSFELCRSWILQQSFMDIGHNAASSSLKTAQRV